MFSGHSCLAMNLMKVACHELGEASKNYYQLGSKIHPGTIGRNYPCFKRKFGLDKDGAIDVNLTREELANMVGTATESVIRLISEFKDEGLIELQGKKIIPKNVPGLIKQGKSLKHRFIAILLPKNHILT